MTDVGPISGGGRDRRMVATLRRLANAWKKLVCFNAPGRREQPAIWRLAWRIIVSRSGYPIPLSRASCPLAAAKAPIRGWDDSAASNYIYAAFIVGRESRRVWTGGVMFSHRSCPHPCLATTASTIGWRLCGSRGDPSRDRQAGHPTALARGVSPVGRTTQWSTGDTLCVTTSCGAICPMGKPSHGVPPPAATRIVGGGVGHPCPSRPAGRCPRATSLSHRTTSPLAVIRSCHRRPWNPRGILHVSLGLQVVFQRTILPGSVPSCRGRRYADASRDRSARRPSSCDDSRASNGPVWPAWRSPRCAARALRGARPIRPGSTAPDDCRHRSR